MTELKKCPFCGSEGELKNIKKGTVMAYMVRCANDNHCHVIPKTEYCISPELAAEVWNKRSE